MPRYFFHITDGAEFPDDEGVILADIAAARTEAMETAVALLRERGGSSWDGTEWRMTVVDHAGKTVCVLRFTAE